METKDYVPQGAGYLGQNDVPCGLANSTGMSDDQISKQS